MRILVLAPHPYRIVRGTSIDLDLLLRVLCARPRTRVDLVCYPEGEDPGYPNLEVHRIPSTPLTRGTKPGFSLRKLGCDVLLAYRAWQLLRERSYDVIHADEEAAFLALLAKRRYGIPYVYDLDSSVAQQMVEKYPGLRPAAGLLDRMEAAAIRGALATAPVCNALADLCRRRGSAEVVTLHDISQLACPGAPRTGKLAAEVGTERAILLYVGNLEAYQGIDLLLESFALAAPRADIDLVVIGGDKDDIARYRARATALGVASRVHFLGPRPLELLDGYLAEADVLVAPRIRGLNTPMKVFPYLHSGRPVLVTDLPTHSQILTPEVAMLAPANPEGFARAIQRLAVDPELRRQLGARGRAFAEADHTFPAHAERVNRLYDYVERAIARQRRTAAPRAFRSDTLRADAMSETGFGSVDEYIAAHPDPVQAILRRVRSAIRRALPRAEESISYQIPAYKLPAGVVIYFAVWARHYSLYPATEELVAAFKSDLAPFEVRKGTIRFPLSEPVPVGLIARIARFRAKETAERTRKRAAARKPRR